MRRIGGEDADIDGPYKTKCDNEEGAADMDKDEKDFLHPPPPGTRRVGGRGAAFDNHTTGKEDNDDDATGSMEEGDEGSEEDPHGYEQEYEDEYYQDSDGHLGRCNDLSVDGSDDLSFERDLSPEKGGDYDG